MQKNASGQGNTTFLGSLRMLVCGQPENNLLTFNDIYIRRVLLLIGLQYGIAKNE